MPADAPRPKVVGGKPPGGSSEASGRIGRNGGGQQGDGLLVYGGPRPAVRRRASLRGTRHALRGLGGRGGQGGLRSGCRYLGGSGAGRGSASTSVEERGAPASGHGGAANRADDTI